MLDILPGDPAALRLVVVDLVVDALHSLFAQQVHFFEQIQQLRNVVAPDKISTRCLLWEQGLRHIENSFNHILEYFFMKKFLFENYVFSTYYTFFSKN